MVYSINVGEKTPKEAGDLMERLKNEFKKQSHGDGFWSLVEDKEVVMNENVIFSGFMLEIIEQTGFPATEYHSNFVGLFSSEENVKEYAEAYVKDFNSVSCSSYKFLLIKLVQTQCDPIFRMDDPCKFLNKKVLYFQMPKKWMEIEGKWINDA